MRGIIGTSHVITGFQVMVGKKFKKRFEEEISPEGSRKENRLTPSGKSNIYRFPFSPFQDSPFLSFHLHYSANLSHGSTPPQIVLGHLGDISRLLHQQMTRTLMCKTSGEIWGRKSSAFETNALNSAGLVFFFWMTAETSGKT